MFSLSQRVFGDPLVVNTYIRFRVHDQKYNTSIVILQRIHRGNVSTPNPNPTPNSTPNPTWVDCWLARLTRNVFELGYMKSCTA